MVLLARVGSGVYNAVLLLHILSVIVAFAPAVVNPLTGPRLYKDDESAGQRFWAVSAANSRQVYLPALAVVGLLGFALVGISNEQWRFSDPWVFISAILWLVIAGIVSAVIVPGQKQMGEGDRTAESKVVKASSIATVLFLVVLFLMVVKPG